MLSLDGLRRDPGSLTAELHAGDGSPFTARLLRPGDAEALGRYLDGLSDTVRRLYAPHPLTAAHARTLCAELDYTRLLPFLAWAAGGTPTARQRPAQTPDPAPGEGAAVGAHAAVVAYFLVAPGLREGEARRYRDHGEGLDAEPCCALAPCVADAWQSRGLGSALLAHVRAGLQRLGCRHLLLWGGVRGDNPQAQGFYRKAGFRHVGDFTSGGLVNHDMVLDLPPTGPADARSLRHAGP